MKSSPSQDTARIPASQVTSGNLMANSSHALQSQGPMNTSGPAPPVAVTFAQMRDSYRRKGTFYQSDKYKKSEPSVEERNGS